MPSPYGVEPSTWAIVADILSRRGERMIPWRTGEKGTWSLSDRFEEIYLDKYSRDQVRTYDK